MNILAEAEAWSRFIQTLLAVLLHFNVSTLFSKPRTLALAPYSLPEDGVPAGSAGLLRNIQARKPFPVPLCLLSVGQHTAFFLGTARFPQHSNSSRKSVLSRPTCHANLPPCPRLSDTEKPKLLRIPSTKSNLKTPSLQEKVGLHSCCNQSTVLPITLQCFRRAKPRERT